MNEAGGLFSAAVSSAPHARRVAPRLGSAGGTSRAFLSEGATSPAWSSDDTRLVYFRGRLGPNTAGGDPLFVADRVGGNARQILAADVGAAGVLLLELFLLLPHAATTSAASTATAMKLYFLIWGLPPHPATLSGGP